MSEPSQPPLPAHLVVLVVDDSKVSRTVSVGLIRNRRRDAQIHEAGDGTAAIALAAQVQPHLVLMDVNMPGITGFEASAQILAARPDTRIAILTANFQEATYRRAAELGITVFRKPIKGEVVDQILELTGVPA